MTYICWRGLELSARIQYCLLGVELLVLVIFAVYALVKVFGAAPPEGSIHPTLGWLWPSGLSLSALVSATLIAVFIYWGWDSAVAVNEETKDPATTPGPRRDPLHAAAARDVRHRLDRHGRLRRRRRHRGRAGQRRQRRRHLRRARHPGLRRQRARPRDGGAPGHHRAHLGLGVHPDDDPADGAHVAVDGGLPGHPVPLRPDPPHAPVAEHVDDLDGRHLDRLLRRA